MIASLPLSCLGRRLNLIWCWNLLRLLFCVTAIVMKDICNKSSHTALRQRPFCTVLSQKIFLRFFWLRLYQRWWIFKPCFFLYSWLLLCHFCWWHSTLKNAHLIFRFLLVIDRRVKQNLLALILGFNLGIDSIFGRYMLLNTLSFDSNDWVSGSDEPLRRVLNYAEGLLLSTFLWSLSDFFRFRHFIWRCLVDWHLFRIGWL